MLPVIAIVGRPNVGKSTIFNCLTQTRDAIVADIPGVTRDRQYGQAKFNDQNYIVIDTGGLSGEDKGIDDLMAHQSRLAIQEADQIIFVVDARNGLTAQDETIAKFLRKQKKSIHLVVNKTDGLDTDIVAADFYRLGFGDPMLIAASHNRGVQAMLEYVLADISKEEEESNESEQQGIKLAIVGRPNAGKSTLVNRMLGEDRVVVFDAPGTTRDSIFLPLERRGKRYTLIDTAGVRRRTRIDESVEKFSVVKTLQSIEVANVVILMLDAAREIADQDLRLIDFVISSGRALVLAINKWDNLDQDQRSHIRRELERRLQFLNFVEKYFISALHGTAVGDLFPAVERAYASATKKVATSRLNKILEQVVEKHQPPLVGGQRIKIRYAHFGGHNPPLIVLHGNQLESLPGAYKRYLITAFQKSLNLVGTPVRLEFKTSENPFKGKKNVLTDRQLKKRKRLKKITKK